ncbi:MAG: DUF465 domain-containing protein [Alphaproteobacteria bacterium]|nr:DUF465 domain-containing protein [Alphaproteobacteria bacterium]
MDDSEIEGATEAETRRKLERLRELHADLSAAVTALQDAPQTDQLQLARLKKRKLLIKDQITVLAATLTPDLIA